MSSKNYYKILDVSHTATNDEIKKAYRQLALKYHPDRNNGDRVSELHFKEIQEAYHILSDSQRRSAYNQKRWYSRHSLKKQAPEPLTAYKIFEKCNELNIYLRKLRSSEINRKPLFSYLRQLLNDDSISVLKAAREKEINKEIVIRLLEASMPLSAMEKEFIAKRLKTIADRETNVLINIRLKETSRMKLWERYQFLVILFFTIILCWIIYEVGS